MTAAMTAAIFRAEFRRALPLLPWLLGCHAITLGLRTRWSDEVTPPVAGIVGWATGSLALLVLIGSIWQDSPSRSCSPPAASPRSRRRGFRATRR